MPDTLKGFPNNIEDKVNRLKDYLNNDANVIFALIFGSAVTGKLKKGSDIDVAIYFKHPLEGLDLLNYISKLSDLVGKDVHLVVLNAASAFLRHQIMKHGAVLLIKDQLAYTRFREKTITDYDEYKYISGMGAYAK
ncbi:MAG: nucleotidyltransferase domain-containing protein [Actinomycetota bacterium]